MNFGSHFSDWVASIPGTSGSDGSAQKVRGQRALLEDVGEVILDRLLVQVRTGLVMILRPVATSSVCLLCRRTSERLHAETATKAAPHTAQVVDCWHLLHSMRAALVDVLRPHHRLLTEVAQAAAKGAKAARIRNEKTSSSGNSGKPCQARILRKHEALHPGG